VVGTVLMNNKLYLHKTFFYATVCTSFLQLERTVLLL